MKILRTTLLALGAFLWATFAAHAQAQPVNIGCINSSGNWTPWFNASGAWQCAGNIPVGVTITPSPSSSVGITPVVCGSAVSSCVLKATPGNLYSVYAECSSSCWLMVFNAISAPSNGATTAGVASGNLVECVPLAAGGVGGVSYLPGPPAVYSVGMTAMISSTTCATLTASTVGFVHGMVQ